MTRLARVSVFAALAVVSSARAAHAGDGETAVAKREEAETEGRSASVKLDAGPAYRQVAGLQMLGGEAGAAFLLHRPEKPDAIEAYARVRYAFYQTRAGLAAHLGRTGAYLELPLGRVRPSIGMDFLWLGVLRTTELGLVQHWGLGLNAALTVDVIRSDRGSALYVGPRFDGDAFPHKLIPRTLSFNVTCDVGYRF